MKPFVTTCIALAPLMVFGSGRVEAQSAPAQQKPTPTIESPKQMDLARLRPTTGPERVKSWQLHRMLKNESPFKSMNWNLVAPVMCGGRIETIACPPGNTSTIYVGAGSGGLLRKPYNAAWNLQPEN